LSRAPLGPVGALRGEHRIDEFASGVPALDGWLHQTARIAAAAGTSATYVLCRGEHVVGYYALAMGSVAHEAAPLRLRRGMPDPVPVIVLARLAVDTAERGAGLGGDLLIDALRRCVRGAREFGARAVVVDAIDENAAAFYRHFDFLELTDLRLWRRISDIERTLSG
jgi:predicted N-acetyltransferase YhbS